MSHISTVKKLCGDDLREVIKAVFQDKLDENSRMFKKVEAKCWKTIFTTTSVALEHQQVEERAYGFVEKFENHFLPQKAKNLKTLLDAYSKLDYFEKYSNKDTQWGLIHVLMKLSHRPTAVVDDPPLNLNDLLGDGESAASKTFDWVAYLKQDLPKYEYPDDSSSSGDDETSTRDHDETLLDWFKSDETLVSTLLTHQLERTREKRLLMFKELLNRSDHLWAQSRWWRDFAHFSEEPSSRLRAANYCRLWWQELRKHSGQAVLPVRLISEYKVMRLLIWTLALVPHKSGLFSLTNGVYLPTTTVSICTLSPTTFTTLLSTQISPFLPYIKELNDFGKMCLQDITDLNCPNVYFAYSLAIKSVMSEFRKRLEEIETVVKAQKGIHTLIWLFPELRDCLNLVQYVCTVHRHCIYSDFTKEEKWKCSMRVLAVWLAETKSGRYQVEALGIFLGAFRPYTIILSGLLLGKDLDIKEEFPISKSTPPKFGFEVKTYRSFLDELNLSSDDFWDPFLSVAYTAASSNWTMKALGEVTPFSQLPYFTNDFLFKELFNRFLNSLGRIFSLNEVPVASTPGVFRFPNNPSSVCPPFQRNLTLFDGSLMDEAFAHLVDPPQHSNEPLSPTTEFIQKMKGHDLSVVPLIQFVRADLIPVIRKYTVSSDSIVSVLTNYGFLDHIRSLQAVYFARILGPFTTLLFEKMSSGSPSNSNWTSILQLCLSDYLGDPVSSKFSIKWTSAILNTQGLTLLGLIVVSYEPDHHFRCIITDDLIRALNDILRVYLEIKWSWRVLCSLKLNELRENTISQKRLMFVRMRLVHAISCLSQYYASNLDELDFEELFINLTATESLEHALNNYVEFCRARCFLKSRCINSIRNLFELCEDLAKAWKAQIELKLKDSVLGKLEKKSSTALMNFATLMKRHAMKNEGIHTDILFDEIVNNLSFPA